MRGREAEVFFDSTRGLVRMKQGEGRRKRRGERGTDSVSELRSV